MILLYYCSLVLQKRVSLLLDFLVYLKKKLHQKTDWDFLENLNVFYNQTQEHLVQLVLDTFSNLPI